MTQYSQRVETWAEDPIKAVILGDSGNGKTGALAALANAGYRLFIFDFDNGAKILGDYLTPEGAKRVYVKTFVDKMKYKGQAILPDGVPTAFVKAMQAMNNWMEGEENLGGPSKWGLNDIAVMDSLTFFARAAMRYQINFNTGGSTDNDAIQRWMHPWPADYGEAQNRVEKFLEMFYSPTIKCHLIVNAHIRYLGGGGLQSVKDKQTGEVYLREVDSEATGTGYPEVIGKKLSPYVQRYFNTVLMTDSEGSGSMMKKVLRTVSQERIPLKSERPSVLPARLVIDGGNPERGLAKVFSLLRGVTPEVS